jgi:hypothetical protein
MKETRKDENNQVVNCLMYVREILHWNMAILDKPDPSIYSRLIHRQEVETAQTYAAPSFPNNRPDIISHRYDAE